VIDALAPSGPVATANPRAQALIAAGHLRVAPKQAWTPVAEFGLSGLDAVNFGPGEPAQAHRRDESIEIAALVRSYEVLEAFAT
jgi:succinyl-diaminopimelate desuccinylase